MPVVISILCSNGKVESGYLPESNFSILIRVEGKITTIRRDYDLQPLTFCFLKLHSSSTTRSYSTSLAND